MSYVVNNFNDYVARDGKALTKALFLGDNTPLYARVMSNVKGSTSVPHIGGDVTLQGGTCVSASGTTPVTEVILSVLPVSYREDICSDDLQDKFPNTLLMAGSNTEGDQPEEFEETFVKSKVSSIAKQLAMTYWQGNTASGPYQRFDGFIKKIDSGSPIDGNTSNATAITKALVVGLVDDVIAKMPDDVLDGDRAVVFVGSDTFRLYVAALKEDNLFHYDPREAKKGVYRIEESNVTLVGVRGLTGTSRMFAGDGANFIIGNDLPEDESVIKAIYDEASDKTIMRAKMKAGTAVANITEIVEFTLSS